MRAGGVPTMSALRTIGWGLPDRFLVNLRFTDVISFTQAGGAYSEVFYRAIGPYDPRVAAGGDYPAYYSQISALYQYQQVLKSKIHVEFMPEGNNLLAIAAEGVLYPTSAAGGVTAMNDAIDKRNSRHCSISIYSTGGKGGNRLSHVMIPNKELGMTRRQYRDDDTTRSAVGALPTKILYWALGTQSNDGATTLTVQARITIKYTIEFQGLVPIDTVDSAND